MGVKKVCPIIYCFAASFVLLAGCNPHQESKQQEDITQPSNILETTNHNVKFLDADGNVCYETVVKDGEKAIYNGPLITKASTTEYVYKFINWDKTLDCVKADTTFSPVFEQINQILEDDQGLRYTPISDNEYMVSGYNHEKLIRNIEIPIYFNKFSVREIGNSAFYNCPHLERVIYHTSVSKISYGAFSYCPELKYVYSYGSDLETNDVPLNIEQYAFSNCQSLTHIVFDRTTETLSTDCVYYCSNLESLYILASKQPKGLSLDSVFNRLAYRSPLICYCYCSFNDVTVNQHFPWTKDFRDVILGFKSAKYLKNFNQFDGSPFPYDNADQLVAFFDIESQTQVAVLDNKELYDRYDSRTIRIPNSIDNFPVTRITHHAFYGWKGGKVLIPSSVLDISSYAFGNSFVQTDEWDLEIFCEYEFKPTQWDEKWCGSVKKVYWYSEEEKVNCWHYIDSVPTLW